MELNTEIQALQQEQQAMLDFTIKLAEINSGSYNYAGLNLVADQVYAEFCKRLQCDAQRSEVLPTINIDNNGNKINQQLGPVLQFSQRLDKPCRILLVGHMDTVFEADHHFQNVTKTAENIINGPGVTDMKGGIAVMLWALQAFEKLPCAKNIGWEVLLNSDEEIGSDGSLPIIMSRSRDFTIGFAFEPAVDDTGLLAGDRKGTANFSFIMRGKAAHAGRDFAAGRNAITAMAKFIQALDALNGEYQDLTINIGTIHGGVATNVVPDCCVCKVNARIPTNDSGVWLMQQITQLVQQYQQDPDYQLEMHGGLTKQPKVVTGNAQMEKLYNLVKTAGSQLGLDLSWQATGGCCDGNNMAAAGLVNVDTLGVRGGKIHSDQEYLHIDSLVERAQLLTTILATIATDGFE